MVGVGACANGRGPARTSLRHILCRVQAGLGALLVLVGRAATDADTTEMRPVCRHDRKAAGEGNDAGNLGDAGEVVTAAAGAAKPVERPPVLHRSKGTPQESAMSEKTEKVPAQKQD